MKNKLDSHHNLANVNPKLSQEWHPNKNGVLTPCDVTPKSPKKVWWMCNNLHEWQTTINHRVNGTGCPYCIGRKVSPTNNLAVLSPELAREWHPINNGVLKPEDITPFSNRKVWWKCLKSNHEWESTINNRSKGKGCPQCDGSQRLSSTNNLLSANFALSKEWHQTKNGDLRPKDFTPSSHKIIWWRCAKGHEWKANINNRSKGGKCPYCLGKKPSLTYNLAYKFPRLAKEWHPHKNGMLLPTDVTPMSGKKIWWICKRGHDWKISVDSRTGEKKSGCPVCNESKGESKVAQTLEKLNIKYRRQATFSMCKNIKPLPFDFIIFVKDKDPGLIEFNGIQHYKPVKRFGGVNVLKEVRHRDAIKLQFAKSKKISMLVISYLEFNQIEELVTKFVDHLPPIRKGLKWKT